MYKKLLTLFFATALCGCAADTVSVSKDVSTEPAGTVKAVKEKRDDGYQREIGGNNSTSKPCKHVLNIINHVENNHCPQHRNKTCSSKNVDCKECQRFEKCLIREAQSAIDSVKGSKCRALSKNDKLSIFENCRDEIYIM